MMDQKKLDEATKWLDKAINLEAEKKSEKMVNLALDKACKLEHEAFEGK